MTEQPTQDEQPFYTKGGFLLAAVFVAAVVVIGLALALTGGTGDDAADSSPTTPASDTRATTDAAPATTEPSESETTSTVAPPTEAGSCTPLSGAGGQDALATGPEVQWHPVGEVAPAFSEDNGPAVRDGVKECFARTPAGALLAGYNFLADVRTSAHDPADVIRTRVDQRSPAYDTLLSYASEERQLTSMSVVGYRFNAVSEDQVTISLVHRMSVSGEVAYLKDEVTLSWVDGDWLVTDVPTPEQIDSLPPDYVPWGPDLGAPE